MLPILLLLLGSAASPSAAAQVQRPTAQPLPQQDEATRECVARLAAAREQLVPDVRRLAAQAEELGFHSAARELYTLLLALDPGSDEAHRGLGHRRRGGEWSEGDGRLRRDRVDDEDRTTFRRAAAVVLEQALARVDAACAGAPDTPALRERERQALAELIALAPDDAALRTRVGDAWDAEHERWDLAEVVAARARRAEVLALLDEVRADLPDVGPVQLDEHARATGFEFPVLLGSDGLAVATTTDQDEARALHELVLTQQAFLRRSFGDAPKYPAPVSVLVLPAPGQKRRYLEAHRLVKPEELEDHLAINGTWILRQLLLSSTEPVERLDMATFLTGVVFLQEVFGKRGEAGWVRQSLASYLSAHVCGTHLSFLVSRDAYGRNDGVPWPARVPPDLVGWLDTARPFLDEERPLSEFARALTVPTSSMTWQDVVVGYAFAAYMFEGRRDDLDRMLRRIGNGEEKIAVLEDVLARPLPAIRARLARWIDRMAAQGN